MTAEEKRERILKRALPALFITIIYFIFISNIMGDQAAKAKDEYNQLMRSGLSPEALPGLYKDQAQASAKLRVLRVEQAKYAQQVKAMAGFISDDSDTMQAATDLAHILARHDLRVTKEVSEPFLSKDLPPSLAEVKKLLQESIKAGDSFNVQHLWVQGRFLDMYAALDDMSVQNLAALPVKFSMSIPDEAKSGELTWELTLWM